MPPTDDVEARLRRLFMAAMDLPKEAWEEFIAREVSDSHERVRLTKLLQATQQSDDFLSKPAHAVYSEISRQHEGMIAEFKILRELGRGGMGIVYLALDTVLSRHVALKVLEGFGEKDAFVDLFRQEAKAVARLDHPGVTQIFRFGEQDGLAYIAMQYVDGITLKELMRRAAAEAVSSHPARSSRLRTKTRPAAVYSPEVKLMIIAEVADALEHAHRQGVIHLDVKPTNILIDATQHAHLTDFGIARLRGEETTFVLGDAVGGTYPYMSPEQARARGGAIDHRTDVFSLGVVLYELLTGTRPFNGSSYQEHLAALNSAVPRRLRHHDWSLAKDIETICHKAIERRPTDRYQSAAHFGADLRSFLAGQPILARPPTFTERTTRWIARHRLTASIALIAILATTSGYLIWQSRQSFLAGQAHLVVNSRDVDAGRSFYLQRWNRQARTFGAAILLDVSSPSALIVAPGLVRLTARDGQGDFAEVDHFLRAGEHRDIRLGLPPNSNDPVEMVQFSGANRNVHYFDPDNGQLTLKSPGTTSFWIDVHEVTNRQYREFVRKTGASEPEFWHDVEDWASIANRPVVDIGLEDMTAYASWAGKRLPTLVEWMIAAQAPDGRRHPWGDDSAAPMEASPSREMLLCVQRFAPREQVQNYMKFVQPVGQSAATVTPTGLHDMFGNVMEMTGTVIANDRGISNVVAGGYWAHDPTAFDLSRTVLYPPNARTMQIGFRCVRSVVSPIR